MKKQSKLQKLQVSVNGATNTVSELIQMLYTAREDAAVLDTQAEEELAEAKEVYETTKANYKELQSRCSKVITFANKVLD